MDRGLYLEFAPNLLRTLRYRPRDLENVSIWMAAFDARTAMRRLRQESKGTLINGEAGSTVVCRDPGAQRDRSCSLRVSSRVSLTVPQGSKLEPLFPL